MRILYGLTHNGLSWYENHGFIYDGDNMHSYATYLNNIYNSDINSLVDIYFNNVAEHKQCGRVIVDEDEYMEDHDHDENTKNLAENVAYLSAYVPVVLISPPVSAEYPVPAFPPLVGILTLKYIYVRISILYSNIDFYTQHICTIIQSIVNIVSIFMKKCPINMMKQYNVKK